jgi:hypothetical protein
VRRLDDRFKDAIGEMDRRVRVLGFEDLCDLGRVLDKAVTGYVDDRLLWLKRSKEAVRCEQGGSESPCSLTRVW